MRPNPSIERASNGRRPSVAAHVKRSAQTQIVDSKRAHGNERRDSRALGSGVRSTRVGMCNNNEGLSWTRFAPRADRANRGVSKPDISITIEKVDGAPVERSVLHTQFAVVPGWHTIEVRYVAQRSRPGGSRIEHGAPIELRVFVEAGRVSRVRGSTVGNTWRAWI